MRLTGKPSLEVLFDSKIISEHSGTGWGMKRPTNWVSWGYLSAVSIKEDGMDHSPIR